MQNTPFYKIDTSVTYQLKNNVFVYLHYFVFDLKL